MSNVTLTIGGRNFTVACAPGEEAHIADLGRMIGVKLDMMGDSASQSESRMLLFAALLLADELHDARVAAGNAARIAAETASAPPPPALPADMGDRLAAIAGRLENLAAGLEGRALSA
jgi:cell division protein ZapA